MESESSERSANDQEQPEQNQIFNRWPLDYWKIFIKFGFYTLLVPFRTKRCSTTGFYKMRTIVIHKIGCTLVAGIMMLNIVRLGKSILQHVPSKQNAVFYFVLASFLFFVVNHFIYFYKFWWKSAQFQDLFECVLKSRLFIAKKSKNRQMGKHMAWTLCGIFFLFAIISFLEVLEEHHWEVKPLFHWFMQSSDELLFKKIENQTAVYNRNHSPSWPRSAMTVVFIVADLYSQLLLAFGDLLFILTVLFYRDLVIGYLKALPDIPHHGIMEHYQELNRVVAAMNNAIGLFTFGFGIGTLPYYADNTQTLFHFTTFIEKFKFFSFCVYNTGFLLFAAFYHSKVEAGMRKWLLSNKNFSKMENGELIMFLHELGDKSNTGISAFGYFTITFQFLGSFTGLLLTYTLILIDFKN